MKKAKTSGKRITVSIPVFLSATDGDISATVCKSDDDAEKFSEQNLRNGNSQLCGEVTTIDVVVNEKGEILEGWEEPEDEDEDEDEDSDDELDDDDGDEDNDDDGD